ncbi:MAG: DUF1501 domain-containing protein [Planctomycetes bacterium]|nr:DUF1501 domain-containing protein [Planctomycetota bacterium]
MKPFDRRKFLHWSAASLTALGLCGMPPFLRRALAGPLTSGKKLLFIFLRGGIDAVQAVIPYGDTGIPGQGKKTYLQARPTLGVDPAAAHDLNGFVSLHPAMQDAAEADGPRLADIFHGTLDGRGKHLAVLHRIGYESQNRSHFSSQQFWENGVPGAATLEAGVFNRYLTEYLEQGNPLPGATVNGNQMVIMKGPTQLPVLRSINDYALPANVPLGTPPSPPNVLGTGLRGAYGQTTYNPAIPYNPLTYSTGVALLDSLRFFEENVRSVPYAPEPEAVPYYAAIADRGFAGFLQDAARLLKQVPQLQITGVNQNGYDTHGGEDGAFPRLVGDLALALTALYLDLKPIWDDTVVVTMSEFGRTSEENGNRGTDHGESTVMFVLGGPVAGGVYNADPSRWSSGDLFSTANGRYVAHRTDFRSVYADLIRKHLGDPAGRIDAVIPGTTALEAQNANGYFSSLGFLG